MILAQIIRALILHAALHVPYDHAYAAVQAETPKISAELLLAQSWKESRWTIDAVSRVEVHEGHRERVGGTWKWGKKFPSYFRGPYFCGASQVERYTEKSCRAIGIDLKSNYAEAVSHLYDWLAYCKKAKKPGLDCAFAGYGGGVKATKRKGKAWRYGQNTQRLGRAFQEKVRKYLQSVDII